MDTSISNLVASMEAIRYSDWYKRRGIRRVDELKQLKLINEESFELPRESIVHYMTNNPNELGIHVNNFLIRQSTGFIGIEHVKKYTTMEGSPIKVPIDVNGLTRKYKNANRDIRPIVNFDSIVKNPENVIIINYALLNQLYSYRQSYLSSYYKFENITNTLIDNINKYSELSTRNQFINLSLPDQVPTYVQFKALKDSMNSTSLAPFNRQSTLIILELYKWISEDREDSIFNRLDEAAIDKVNLVFTESGKSSILNLGNLNKWRKSLENPDGKFAPTQLNHIFLSFIRAMAAIRLLGKEDVNSIDISDDISKAELADLDVVLEEEVEEYDEDGELVSDSSSDFTDSGDISSTIDKEEVYEDKFGKTAGDLTKGVDETELVKTLLPSIRDKVSTGEITEKQAKRYVKLASESLKIADPYGGNENIGELLAGYKDTINKLSVTKIPDKKTVIDKSMLESKLPNITKDYVKYKLKSDIVASVYALQNDGYIIRDYSIDDIKDVHNEIEIHTVRVETIGGDVSTIKFKVPVIREDGTYFIGGVKYYLRKGRRDVPIRKVKPWKAFLTSYHSKLPFIKSQKVVDDYAGWMRKQIEKLSRNDEHPLTILESRDVFDHLVKLPRFYTMISKGIVEVDVAGLKLNFEYADAVEKYGEAVVEKFTKGGEMIIGKRDGEYILVDDAGLVRSAQVGKKGTMMGSLLDVLQIPEEVQLKAPVDKVQVSIVGKKVPVCALIAYRFGLENLINALKLTYRRVPKGTRLKMGPDEYAVAFASDTLIFRREEYLGQLIMGSLNAAKDALKLFELEDFNSRDEIWGDVLQRMGYGPRVYREFESLYNIWLDPMTVQALEIMKEPTKFRPLVIRAVEILTTDWHLKEMHGSGFMTKGYERVAGFIYKNLSDSVRTQKARQTSKKLDMNPNAVWEEFEKDTSKQIVEESNPVQNLKEMSNLTFSGTGGQTSRIMVKHKREFDPNDLGLISEGGVDNGDVGVTTFLTYDPKVTNLLGMADEAIPSFEDAAKFQSTSFLVSPFADRDDGKRAVFIGVQMAHVVACQGYEVSLIRTGGEAVIGNLVDDIFAVKARSAGVIKRVTKDLIVIEYDDINLKDDHVFTGRRYGVVTGKTIPHDIVTDVVVGTKVFEGYVVAWNVGFFERDVLEPGGVLWKRGIPSIIALVDGPETIEDSCRVGLDLSKKLTINTTGIKEITATFDQALTGLVEVGTDVATDSVLAFLEDSVTAGTDLFDEFSIQSLNSNARLSPKAGKAGKVSKIEVIYNGDIEDATESVRNLILKFDGERAKDARKYKDGRVTIGQAADLPIDTVIVRVYIDSTNDAADCDKIVVGHQLKSVIGSILVGENKTIYGEDIDVFFAHMGVNDRIVMNLTYNGMLTVLTEKSNDRAIAAALAVLEK